MTITIKQLEVAGACSEQMNPFKATFGESVEVTRELCEKHAQDFNFTWAKRLLIAPALAAYDAAIAPARAAYDAACAAAVAPARAAYDAAKALAFFVASLIQDKED